MKVMSEPEESSVWLRPCQPLHGEPGGFRAAFTLAFRLSESSRDTSDEASLQELEEMLERPRGSLTEGGTFGAGSLRGGERGGNVPDS